MRLMCFFALVLTAMAVAAAERLPTEVSSFIDQREACDHWRGEYGYDEERQADIDYAVCQSCVGTDARLAKLKQKYLGKNEVLKRLEEFEPDIEPEDNSKTVEFCKMTSRQHDLKH